MKYKGYIYPITTRSRKQTSGIYNPYLDNFIKSVGKYVDIINKDNPSSIGIFHIVKYIGKINIVFLNWIEDLPDKKSGRVQSLFFLLLLYAKRLLGIKIVWTMHNKISHSSTNSAWKRMLFKALIKRSDLIITHAREGINFAHTLVPDVSEKFFYFPHPIVPFQKPDLQKHQKYDCLIWGTITPYKGIDIFLEYLEENDSLDKYKILIAGKALSDEFYQKITKFERENIIIQNQFIDSETLGEIISQSGLVLFTYSGESVLSSGVLIDSVAYYAHIVGPSVGAFKEMGELGIIKTYNDFDELMDILENVNGMDRSANLDTISQFIENHSWDKFASAVFKVL